MNPVPPELREYLLSAEQVVWSGQPAQGITLRAMDIFIIPFSILWAAFAVFWNYMAWTQDGDIFFGLFGIPFLLAAFYITIGRLVHDAIIRRGLTYALTNKRAIVFKSALGRSMTSLDLERLPTLDLNEKKDGRGTIAFEKTNDLFDMGGFAIWVPSLTSGIKFLNIESVRRVYELVQQQRR